MDQQNPVPPPAMPEMPPPTPPAVAWTPPVATAPAAGRVTGLAKIASGILIFFGILFTLLGLLAVGGGALFGAAGSGSDFESLAGAFGAVIAALGVIVLVIGIVEILAGIGAWRGSSAGRIVGIVYGVLGALGGLGGLQSDSGPTGGVIALLLYGFVAVVLLFRWKEPASA
jgi:hypothetical protein